MTITYHGFDRSIGFPIYRIKIYFPQVYPCEELRNPKGWESQFKHSQNRLDFNPKVKRVYDYLFGTQMAFPFYLVSLTITKAYVNHFKSPILIYAADEVINSQFTKSAEWCESRFLHLGMIQASDLLIKIGSHSTTLGSSKLTPFGKLRFETIVLVSLHLDCLASKHSIGILKRNVPNQSERHKLILSEVLWRSVSLHWRRPVPIDAISVTQYL